MDKAIKLFIVEGEDRDYRFINKMADQFFKGKYDTRVFVLPANMNIYMLFNLMKEDSFNTDVLEVLRENIANTDELENINRQQISEIYLFFDYDCHQENLPNGVGGERALNDMIDAFDNETENGKLYISYPMVEALYDCIDFECRSFSDCFYPIEEIGDYKSRVGTRNPFASHHLTIEDWRVILGAFGLRVACLFDKDVLGYDTYRQITPKNMYEQERKVIAKKGSLFVISAFPEFLYDYFPIDFWHKFNTHRRFKYKDCAK